MRIGKIILGNLAIIAVAIAPIGYLQDAMPRLPWEMLELMKIYIVTPVMIASLLVSVLFRYHEFRDKLVQSLAIQVRAEVAQQLEVEKFLQKKKRMESEMRAKKIAENTAKAAGLFPGKKDAGE